MVEDTALSHLRSLLDVQVQLTHEQEERAKQACRKLVEMLESLDPAAVEQLNRGGQPVENLCVDALVDLFLRFLRNKMVKLTAEKQALENDLSRLQTNPDEILQLKMDLETLQDEKKQLTQAFENAKEQIKGLQDQLTVARQTARMAQAEESQSAATPLDEAFPQWLLIWQTGRGYEREALFLQVIGETGWSCVPHIQQEVLSRLNRNIETIPNSIKDIHRRLDEAGLVELDRPWQQEAAVRVGGCRILSA
jgi:DNA repair exonuclease SbcCD ATPase subunit